MRRQVMRRLRRRTVGEIGGRRDGGHPHIRPDSHGDHVLPDSLAEAHPSVEAFGHDIDEARLDGEFDLNIGIGGQ